MKLRRGSVRVFVCAGFIAVFALPFPLAATCTCTVQATAAPPDLHFTGTSAGTCERRTAIVFHLDGGELDFVDCGRTTSCTRTGGPGSTTCLRTGPHTVSADCECGKNATDAAGNPFCDRDAGHAETNFFVNTTPTVSISASGPDELGEVVLTIPYTFPNTLRGRERDLALYVDGNFLLANGEVHEAGTWTVPLRTDCWRQGPHELKVVAGACGRGSDPAYRAEAATTIFVNHEPRISLTIGAAPPGSPPDRHLAKVTFDYPQTQKAEQRGLRLQAFPSGGLLGEFNPSKQGVWEVEVSCREGANRLLVATGFACGDTKTEAVVALPECAKPPRIDPCKNECGCSAGPPGAPGAPVGGGPPAFFGASTGPGARLSYLGGGVGNRGNPGRAEWTPTLGRNWSHDYVERIVADPSVAGRVWLLTRAASFVRFTDQGGDGAYEAAFPEDEKRLLSRAASGWELRDLDGTVQAFDASGRWTETRDRHGNAKTATYAEGRLASVAMPDGRREEFGYDAAGKLASITEIGVGGAAQRTWAYRWSGDDLTAIERPDGTELRFAYGDSRHPGLITRYLLVGADDGDPASPRPERIEGAWEYDGEGNVLRTWRGAPDFAAGVDRVELAYDNPFEPEETTVTYHRSATERDLVVYRLARTVRWSGAKQRIVSISGDCSSCGLAPNTQLFYDDPANPLRPTRTVDGRGHETLLSYDAHGRLIEKIEAVGTPESRTTRWSYDPAFPALVTRIEVPSTSGGAALRTTIFGLDAAGNATSRRMQGVEAGSFFDLETVTDFNAAGQPLAIDPPGHGTDDVTRFTYDPLRGDLLPATRTDPLVGTTTFEHDPFNRRTAVVDPNELRTETVYDAADRVVAVIQRGETPAEDLVTEHRYDAFGDLFRTILPRGNAIEYGYDATGRLVSVERKSDAESASERTLYTLDGSGNRIREELQRWGGEGWVTESFTETRYANRCQVEKIVHADGTAIEHAYDCGGNLEKVWDENHPREGSPGSGRGEDEDCDERPCGAPPGQPNEPTQRFEYDALDRLVAVRQPWTGAGGGEAVTRYGYDVQDHLVAVADAEGNETTYTYSDRDLMTRQVSLVSGTTTYAYNEHGELVAETDARGITTARTIDPLGRVTFVDSPDPALDTTYTYDAPGEFATGRLTAISRAGETLAYAYDRFGRLVRDGELTYAYDANGNRIAIGYPGSVTARYGHDFADRERSLELHVGSAPAQALVHSARYAPFGPLTALSLGNGLSETRTFTPRYQPETIQVPGRLDQRYQTDAAGNIRSLDRAVGADRFFATYSYQAPQYFLTEGNGPWGQRAWTYDRIGNRLSETAPPRDGDLPPVEFDSTYEPNSAGGNTPKLVRIAPAPGGEPGSFAAYGYDAAGDQTTVEQVTAECSSRTSFLAYNADRRLARLRTSHGPGRTELSYDGRGFLRRSRLTFAGSNDFSQTEPVYSSEGLLFARKFHQQITRKAPGDGGSSTHPVTKHTTYLFYFAGRPVAQLRQDHATVGGGELLFLTTDHLGAPILATDRTGAQVWAGGLDPFGTPYVFPRTRPPGEEELIAPPEGEGASANSCEPEEPRSPQNIILDNASLFLRFPGQWDDPSLRSHGIPGGLYYNVHRWYQPGTGRYTRVDPIFGPRLGEDHDYVYTRSNPISQTDPLGLFTVDDSCVCSEPGIPLGQAISRACQYLGVPGCRQALRTRGLEDCFQETCRPPLIGGPPHIRCFRRPNACGQHFPSGDINLYTGEQADCPRFHQGPGKPRGPRDYGQTLFHEIGHRCGVPADEPGWWQDVQRVCTGWPL